MTKYIVISGVDSSGKATVINSLKDKLEQQGRTADYIWMRYNHYTVKAMNASARILGLSVKVHNKIGNMWEYRLYKMPWFCKLYVWCFYLDNKIAQKKAMKLKSDYVICDRWTNDVLIDLGAECRFSNILDSKWYKKFHTILSQNSYQFVVIRDYRAILDCRVENQANPDFPYCFALYQKLVENIEVNVVDNSRIIEEGVEQVIRILNKSEA